MSGETNLAVLLANATPEHNAGNYVFCKVISLEGIDLLAVSMMFREKEAITLILSQEYADFLRLEYSSVFAWITLTIHSSLDAVGLTAAFSSALAKVGISCNVVAAFHHDHIFVGAHDVGGAMKALRNLSSLG